MHVVRFFPIGNGDSCFIELENGRTILFDYADLRDPNDDDDLRCDLLKELKACLGDRKEIDVVAFTHFDRDHCHRAKDVFYLEHAEKYQSDDRIKIKTLWVPANAVLEKGVKGQARTLRAEARHRFINGEGVRVFSRPESLDDFLTERGIDPAQRRNRISDAGTICPEFHIDQDGVEFFVHSPFAERTDDGVLVRNDDAIFMQATFRVDGQDTKLILSADLAAQSIDDIVRITRHYKNDARLEWDVNNVPHHSSYLSLSIKEEKGKDETVPSDRLKWLYEEQGRSFSILVSTSDPIPSEDTTQPPHRQAANYYRSVAKKHAGQYVVTMEHPTQVAPKPLVINIGTDGASVKKLTGGQNTVVAAAAPRAG